MLPRDHLACDVQTVVNMWEREGQIQQTASHRILRADDSSAGGEFEA